MRPQDIHTIEDARRCARLLIVFYEQTQPKSAISRFIRRGLSSFERMEQQGLSSGELESWHVQSARAWMTPKASREWMEFENWLNSSKGDTHSNV